MGNLDVATPPEARDLRLHLFKSPTNGAIIGFVPISSAFAVPGMVRVRPLGGHSAERSWEPCAPDKSGVAFYLATVPHGAGTPGVLACARYDMRGWAASPAQPDRVPGARFFASGPGMERLGARVSSDVPHLIPNSHNTVTMIPSPGGDTVTTRHDSAWLWLPASGRFAAGR